MQYFFFAPIANAGGQFRSISLAPPFRIERWPYERLIQLFTAFEGLSEWHPDPRFDDLCCVPHHRKTGHVVTAEIDLASELDQDLIRQHGKLRDLERSIHDQFKLIRLFFAGPVELPAAYWYQRTAKTKYEMVASTQSGHIISEYQCAINKNQANAINDFLNRFRWPPTKNYIKIAVDHWETSFQAYADHLRLVSLVTCLEALFNTSRSEVRQRVSRSAAVLLGTDPKRAEEIYDEIKLAYDVRSKIVHTGKTIDLKTISLCGLRNTVSDSIKRCWELDLDKDELAKVLNQAGFGSALLIAQKYKDDGRNTRGSD